ncbi:MAG: fluoride efflux transporter FluC [Acidimicrobiales bacterium]
MSTPHVPEPIDPDLAPSFWRQRAHPGVLISLGAGGAVGTGARDWISTAVHVSPGTFPWATFWINVTGAFILGVGLTLILERLPPSRYIRPFFATGFCGGYTTFSTFMVDTDLLIRARQPVIAAAYLIGSTAAGLLAAYLGAVWGRLAPLELAPLVGHRIGPRRTSRSRT